MSDFMIGTTLETMTALDELTEAVPDPKSQYLPYARVVRRGDQSTQGVGLPSATWQFPVLTLAERNQVRSFCTGSSAEVFIQTKLDDDTFGIFSGTMLWPVGEERSYGLRTGLAVRFVGLVEVGGS